MESGNKIFILHNYIVGSLESGWKFYLGGSVSKILVICLTEVHMFIGRIALAKQGDNALGSICPSEGLRVCVSVCTDAVDRLLVR